MKLRLLHYPLLLTIAAGIAPQLSATADLIGPPPARIAAFPMQVGHPTYVWTGTSPVNNRDWDDPANWLPSGVPSGEDIAEINSGSPDASGNHSVYEIDLNGGALTASSMSVTVLKQSAALSGTVNIDANGGQWTWSGGQINGAYSVPAGAQLQIVGSADHDMPSTTLTSLGTVVWSGGRIRGGGSGTQIVNNGLWDVQGDSDMNSDYCCSGFTFSNLGTFRKSGGISTTRIVGSVLFVNAGTVDAETNTVSFNNGGLFESGAKFTGAGTALLNGGTFTMDGQITSSNLVQVGGNLVGTNTLVGLFVWNSGSWNSSGLTTIAAGSELRIATSADHDLPNHTLTNLGTVHWTGGRVRGGGSGTSIVNLGLWDDETSSAINADYCCSGTTFNNQGTFRKSADSGTTVFVGGVTLINSGTLDVQTGTVTVNGGGSSSGIVNTEAGATVSLNSNFTLAPGTTLGGPGVNLNGGTLTGTWTGALNWLGGALDGTVVLPTNAVLFIAGPNDHDMPNCTLTNYGTVAWSGGRVRGGGGGTEIWNFNLWDAQTDQEINANYCCGGMVFNNQAIFRKSGGTNSTLIQPGVTFINPGTVDVQTNTLSFNGGGVFEDGGRFIGPGVTLLAGGAFSLSGTVISSNMVQVGGTLTGTNVLSGVFTWNAGDWNSSGLTTIAEGSILRIQTATDHDLPNHTLTNRGTILWTGGRVRGGGNGTLIWNLGLWDDQTSFDINADFCCGGVTFNNQGTFRKSVDPGNTTIRSGVVLNNTGTIDAETGSVVVDGGGVSSGTFSSAGSATIDLNASYRLSSGAAFVGSGGILTAGSLSGTWTGTLTWLGGQLAGTVVVPTNGFLVVAGASDHDMFNCTLTNLGTVNWTGGRIRGGGNGTSIWNLGLWDDQTSFALNADYCCSGVSYNNAGIFRKSVDTGTTVLSAGVAFNNTGTVDAQTGAMVINGGGVNSGTFSTATNATIELDSNYTLDEGAAFHGIGASLTAGSLSGTWTGQLTWLGGQLGGLVVIPTNGVLIIDGLSDHDMYNCTLTNHGTVTWTSGRVRGGSNGTLIWNDGLWDAQRDYDLNADYCCGGVQFDNFGVFRKSAGGGSTTLQSGVTLDNAGTIDVQSGTVTLNGGYDLTGGTLNFGLSSATVYGQVHLNGHAALTGTVSANLEPGYEPVAPTSYGVISYGSFSDGFTGVALPAAWEWATNYSPTLFTLTLVQAQGGGSPVIVLNQPSVAQGQVLLEFTLTSGSATSFTLLRSGQVAGPYEKDAGAVLSPIQAGKSYRFTTTVDPANPSEFYRVQSP